VYRRRVRDDVVVAWSLLAVVQQTDKYRLMLLCVGTTGVHWTRLYQLPKFWKLRRVLPQPIHHMQCHTIYERGCNGTAGNSIDDISASKKPKEENNLLRVTSCEHGPLHNPRDDTSAWSTRGFHREELTTS
jgi:hypothetical protein